MTYWVVLWVGLVCPGGWFSGAIPGAVRPFVCQKQPQELRTASKKDAYRKVQDLGPDAWTQLYWCRGLRCWEKPAIWTPRLEIKE